MQEGCSPLQCSPIDQQRYSAHQSGLTLQALGYGLYVTASRRTSCLAGDPSRQFAQAIFSH